MATFVSKSRVRETSVTTGTGALTLAAAVADHQRFSAVMSVSDTCWYMILNTGAGEWEVGVGTYSSVNTLTRTNVLESTNGNAPVNFSAGTKDVAMVTPGFIASHAYNTIEEALTAAATTNLGSVGTRRVSIGGTTTITSFGSTANLVKFLRFTDAAGTPITYNATTMILPNAASLTAYIGDTAIVASDASGNWRMLSFQRAANAAGAGFPAGTSIVFRQTTPPTYWSKHLLQNDKALRVVSGVAGEGGSLAFSTFASRTATDGHALTEAELGVHAHGVTDGGHIHGVTDPGHGHGVTDPGHAHGGVDRGTTNVNATAGASSLGVASSGSNTDNNTTGISVNNNGAGTSINNNTTGLTVNNAGSGANHTHPVDMRLAYCDVIIGVKD